MGGNSTGLVWLRVGAHRPSVYTCGTSGACAGQLDFPEPGDYALLLAQRGTAQYLAHYGYVPIVPGNVLLITGGATRRLDTAKDFSGTLVLFDRSTLYDTLRTLWREHGLVRLLLGDLLFPLRFHNGMMHLECTQAEAAQWSAELEALGEEMLRDTPSESYLRGCLLKIIAVLNRALLREDEGACLPLQEEVWAVADYVESQVAQGAPVHVGELADQVGMTRAQFIRLWRQATGTSPMDYYHRRRVLYAARLLAEDPDSVTEISHRMGFADAAHFCRQFKRIMGVNPSEYRKRFGEDTAGRK